MLEELLGTAAPPDMSTEILSKLNGDKMEMVSPVSIIRGHQKKRTAPGRSLLLYQLPPVSWPSSQFP